MSMLVITGGTGKKSGGSFIKNVAANLEKVKNRFPNGIRMLVRATSNTDKLSSIIPEAELCVGDLKDVHFLIKSLQSADTIVHIAGIIYSKKIVDAAIKCGVRRLILVHTTGIYSRYKNAGEAYRRIDRYVIDKCTVNNILLTILRPTMIYGNMYDNNMAKFIKLVDFFSIVPVVNGAKYELQPVHYKDLGLAYYNVLMNEDNTINKNFILSGEKPIMLIDVYHEIEKCLGKKKTYLSLPFWLVYLVAWIIYIFSLTNMDYREKVQRLCEPRAYSHHEAEKAFGYKPRKFSEGIQQEVREYLEN